MRVRILVLLAIAVSFQVSAVADEPAAADDLALIVKNDSRSQVGLWIRSEKNTSADPWAHQLIEPNENGKFVLHSPDRFIIVVDAGDQRSRSKPVALKEFLGKHPKYVMQVGISKVFGNLPGGSSLGGEIRVNVGPPMDFEEGVDEYLPLDLTPEEQPQ